MYTLGCLVCKDTRQEKAPLIPGAVVNEAIREVFNGLNTSEEIQAGLFNFTRNALNEAMEKGIGEIGYTREDKEFIERVKYNNAVFSAFKVHREQNDLAKLLTDEDGNVKSFDAFRKDAEKLIGTYNTGWLQTEYNTAITRARVATRFRQFAREKHIYPNIKWLPSVSANPRESHRAFYNRVWAQDDPFWNNHKPGDEWGCKCSATSTADPVDKNISGVNMPEPAEGLDNNPEKDAKLFSDSHPYVKDGYGKLKDRERVARQAANKGTLKDWIVDISDSGKVRGRVLEVGTLGKKVKAFLKKEGIKPENEKIIISDTAIRHMTRDVKPSSPGVEQITGITEILKENLVFYDTRKQNLVYFHKLPGKKYVKFIVQPGYKYKINGEKVECNYVVTGGIVDISQVGQKEYKKIKT